MFNALELFWQHKGNYKIYAGGFNVDQCIPAIRT